MLLVARRMSSTTQVVPDKSVCASASKSAGVEVVCNLTVAVYTGDKLHGATHILNLRELPPAKRLVKRRDFKSLN